MLFVCYPKCSTCQKAKAWLQERGVAAIYGPGTPMLDSVRDVLNLISQHHD